MSVRNSERKSEARRAIERHLALVLGPGVQHVAAQLIELHGGTDDDWQGGEVTVDAVDYHLALTVEAAMTATTAPKELVDGIDEHDEAHVPVDAELRLADALSAAFESPDPIVTREAAGEALRAYYRVRDAVDKEQTRLGRPVRPIPDRSLVAYLAEVRAEHARARPTLDILGIVRHSDRRAKQLGFSPSEVWGKQQGSHGPRHAALRNARATIVLELREKGARLPDIGSVFGGRKRESVHELEKLGRKLRADEGEKHGQ